MKKAIVTLAVGDTYLDLWTKICKKNWDAYCERHGYDLIVFERPLDMSERARQRSPAWQKCLILGADAVRDHERVVWIDSDIMINPAAPSVIEGVPLEKIGATDESVYPNQQDRRALISGMIETNRQTDPATAHYWQTWLDPRDWHGVVGLPRMHSHIVQSGVLVFSPKYHRELLEHVYNSYENQGGSELNYEMRPLSHEIQTYGLQHWIDSRFNALVFWLISQTSLKTNHQPTTPEIYYFLLEQYLRNHFLHFAGRAALMPMFRFLGE